MRRRCAAFATIGVLTLVGVGCGDDGEPADTTVEDGGIERRDPPTVDDRGS